MIQIFWFTLWIATVIFFISYFRIRDKIPFYKRERFEKILMVVLVLLLLVDVSFLINERRKITEEINDCIRFYRYFPNFYNDTEFYFINEWCYNYFDEEEIRKLRDSGLKWHEEQLTKGDFILN